MTAREKTCVRVASILCFGLTACQKPVVMPAPPPATVARSAPPQVLDAFDARDRAWAYADGRVLRQAVLPDLLSGVSALRADIQVGVASMAAQCGYQPLLAIDELLVRVRWDTQSSPAWAAVLRMQEPLDRHLGCLRVLVPEARDVQLDGRQAWQLPRMLVVYDEGLFVVASSAVEAQSTIGRMAHPDPAALQARGALGGLLFSASAAAPNPFGMDALGIRWAPAPTGSRLDLSARFPGETSARQAESIARDGLLQLLGSSASFDPSSQGAGERVVQGSTVRRDGATLVVGLDFPVLAGQTAFVSKLVALVARGVRQHTAWDLTGEARETVYVIARALVDYAVRARAAGRHARFPPSAPLVPEEIPYGKRVAPNPRSYSHPSWQDIGFSIDHPTFYAYDFVTAKDGRSAVVRARGDIDGDGTTSLFELDVRLDAHESPVIAPMMRERDPEE